MPPAPSSTATGNAVVVCGSDAGSRIIDTNGDAAWTVDLPTVRNVATRAAGARRRRQSLRRVGVG